MYIAEPFYSHSPFPHAVPPLGGDSCDGTVFHLLLDVSGDDPGPPPPLCAAGGDPSHSTASGPHTLPRSAPL